MKITAKLITEKRCKLTLRILNNVPKRLCFWPSVRNIRNVCHNALPHYCCCWSCHPHFFLHNSKQNLKSLMAGVYWRHGETLIINIRKTPIRTEASVDICTQNRARVGAVPTWHAQKSWAYHQVSSSTSTHPPSEWQTISSQHAQMCFWWLGPSS